MLQNALIIFGIVSYLVLNVLDEHITVKNREAKELTLKYKIIEEIFTSEESYLRNLEVAMKVCY